MSNISDMDWFWPAVAIIVIAVLTANTIRDIHKDQVAVVCLQQHKSIQYDDNNDIISCK